MQHSNLVILGVYSRDLAGDLTKRKYDLNNNYMLLRILKLIEICLKKNVFQAYVLRNHPIGRYEYYSLTAFPLF